MADLTQENVRAYAGARAESFLWPAERWAVRHLLRPAMRVLDLGCGRGRITQCLVPLDVRVVAADLNFDSLRACREATVAAAGVSHAQLDARFLPFRDRTFDVVLYPFNGLDFISPLSARVQAVAEIARILKPGGAFVFSSHNPLGTVFTPRGVLSLASWRWRLGYLGSGSFRERYARDANGLLLYQAPPPAIIREVERATDLRFVRAMSRSGLGGVWFLLCLSSAWPYYVFRKKFSDVDPPGQISGA